MFNALRYHPAGPQERGAPKAAGSEAPPVHRPNAPDRKLS